MSSARWSAVVLAVAFSSSWASFGQAIDVDFGAITSGPNLDDGVLVDYFLSFSLEGSNIATAGVFEPGDPPTPICDLVEEDEDDWNCDLPGFASLDEICSAVGFGDFLLLLNSTPGVDDSFTVGFDPGCSDPFRATRRSPRPRRMETCLPCRVTTSSVGPAARRAHAVPATSSFQSSPETGTWRSSSCAT